MAETENMSIERQAEDIYRRHFKEHYAWPWHQVKQAGGMIYDIVMGLAADRLSQQPKDLPFVIPDDKVELQMKAGGAQDKVLFYALKLAGENHNPDPTDPGDAMNAYEMSLHSAVIEAAPLFEALKTYE